MLFISAYAKRHFLRAGPAELTCEVSEVAENYLPTVVVLLKYVRHIRTQHLIFHTQNVGWIFYFRLNKAEEKKKRVLSWITEKLSYRKEAPREILDIYFSFNSDNKSAKFHTLQFKITDLWSNKGIYLNA